jgi:predicted ArsR family transcriptional regulator
MSHVLETIFGNRSATYVLLYLQHYSEGHASRMAKTFHVSAMGLQRQLNRLENNGVLMSRLVGRTRVFTFNDTDPTVRSLRKFLESELKRMPDMFREPAIDPLP